MRETFLVRTDSFSSSLHGRSRPLPSGKGPSFSWHPLPWERGKRNPCRGGMAARRSDRKSETMSGVDLACFPMPTSIASNAWMHVQRVWNCGAMGTHGLVPAIATGRWQHGIVKRKVEQALGWDGNKVSRASRTLWERHSMRRCDDRKNLIVFVHGRPVSLGTRGRSLCMHMGHRWTVECSSTHGMHRSMDPCLAHLVHFTSSPILRLPRTSWCKETVAPWLVSCALPHSMSLYFHPSLVAFPSSNVGWIVGTKRLGSFLSKGRFVRSTFGFPDDETPKDVAYDQPRHDTLPWKPRK